MSRSLRVAPEHIRKVKSAPQRNGFPSQKSLADAMGMSRATINSFLNGKPVDYGNFVEICEKLGLDWQAIINTEATNDEGGEGNDDRQPPCVKENLPRQNNEFIGRQDELKRLMEYLSEDHPRYVITVGGIGGVGKTALVLEAAHRCLKASLDREGVFDIPNFEAIIYISAKKKLLIPGEGRVERVNREENLGDIFRVIGRTLEDRSITEVTTEKEQVERVKQSLSQQRTMLILDNLETIDERKRVISFLHDNLPPTVKAVITTRDGNIDTPIELKTLPENDSVKLIEQQVQYHNIIPLSKEDSKKLCQATHGLPLAIVYAVGRLKLKHTLPSVLEDLHSHKDDLALCLFEVGVGELKENYQAAYKLLMSVAIFHKTPVREAVVNVAGLDTEPQTEVDRSLARLEQLSFIKQDNERCEMLSLTREYALAQLRDEANEDFRKKALERRVNWYLKFAKENGGEDWKNWQFQYNSIEEEWENLLAVLEWGSQQKSQKYYEYVRDIWKQLNRFANIYGYWRERIKWLDWLHEASINRNEWSTAVYAMAKKGWTLTLKGRSQDLEAADKLFTKAWEQREQANLDDKIYLANHIAALRIRQQKYEEATEWLNRADELFQDFCRVYPDVEEKERTRRWIRIPYYQAQIHYYQGDYRTAKERLEKVLNDANESEWQRVATDARNWLADVLIKQVDLDNLEEAKKLLKEAKKLLDAALEVAESNQNKRRVALCQRSYARLEFARPEPERNSERIREWAEQAFDGFDALEMAREADEMRALLDSVR